MNTLGYRQWGIPGERTVVLIHGFLGTGDDWTPIADRLGEDTWRVAIDLPGHGGSVGLDSSTYTPEGALEAFEAFLEEHGIQKPLIAGYSMGGRLALAYALNHADNVAGLLLESTSPGILSEAERENRLLQDFQRARLIRTDYESFLDCWIELPFFDSLRKREDLIQHLKTCRLNQEAEEIARAIGNLGIGNYQPMWERLTEFPVPVYVIGGSLDEKYDAIGRELAVSVPKGRYFRIENAGHNVHIESPEAYVETLRKMIEEVW